jgi:hypothetical protein
MALVSISRMVSRSGVQKSLISSTNDLWVLCKPLSTIGMLRPKKYVTPITTSMSNAAQREAANQHSNICGDVVTPITTSMGNDAQRRVANRHSNIWDDDVIHSLSTSYEVFSLISFFSSTDSLPSVESYWIHRFNLCNFTC